jgi:hypothetical protein
MYIKIILILKHINYLHFDLHEYYLIFDKDKNISDINLNVEQKNSFL